MTWQTRAVGIWFDSEGKSFFVYCAVFLINVTCGLYRLTSCDSEIHSFHLTGYAPVTAITFLDKLTLNKKDAARKKAQRTTGSSRQTTFFISNYITPEHDKSSCEVDRAALDILDSALVSAERFIQSRMQREQNQLEKEVVVEGNVSTKYRKPTSLLFPLFTGMKKCETPERLTIAEHFIAYVAVPSFSSARGERVYSRCKRPKLFFHITRLGKRRLLRSLAFLLSHLRHRAREVCSRRPKNWHKSYVFITDRGWRSSLHSGQVANQAGA